MKISSNLSNTPKCMDAFSQANVMHYNEVNRVVYNLFHLKKISLPRETRLITSTREKKEEAGKMAFCPKCSRQGFVIDPKGIPSSPIFSQLPKLAVNALQACVRAISLQPCPTLCDRKDCSPPGSSVHGILLARILEWVAMPSSRVSSPHRG